MDRRRSSPFHSAWFFALALLVINDRLLKGSGLLPGALTGKLSDVAGMFVAPPVLAFLFRARGSRGLAGAHLAVGVGFTAFELSSGLTSLAQAVYGAVGLTWHATYDLTDLLVLPLLLVSFELSRRAMERPRAPRALRPQTAAVIGALACAASEDPPPMTGTCTDCDLDGFEYTDDCNDYDAAVNPGAGNCPGADAEACDDGIDNDGNGQTDCDDSACQYACAELQAACTSAEPFNPSTQALLEDTTQGGTWASEGSCGGADAPERLYQLQIAQRGTLVVGIPDNHAVYVRETCSTIASELGCASSDDTDTFIAAVESGTYTLAIDAFDGLAADDFSVPVQFVAACSELPSLPEGESSWLLSEGSFDFTDLCGAPGADVGLLYTPSVSGTLTLTALWPDGDVLFGVSSSCEIAPEGCSGTNQATLHVTAGQPLFVTLSASAPFTPAVPENAVQLTATLTPDVN